MVSFVFSVNYANFLYCILKLDLKGKLRLEALLKFSFYSSSFFIYLMILVEAVKKCLKQKRFQNHPFSSSPSLQNSENDGRNFNQSSIFICFSNYHFLFIPVEEAKKSLL